MIKKLGVERTSQDHLATTDMVASVDLSSNGKVAFVELCDQVSSATREKLNANLFRLGMRIAEFEAAAPVLARLAADAPQRVCTRTFSLGDVIWKCRTCQVGDETCVVCQECFQNGDHKGHDVSFYVSIQI